MTFEPYHPLLLACRTLGAAFDAHDASMAEQLGVSRNELRLVNQLEEGPRSQLDIAGHLHLSRAAVTVMVDRLTRENLVTRERSPHDRRVNLVTLTPKVWRILAQHYQPAGQRVLETTASLTPTDVDQLTRHLHLLARALSTDTVPRGSQREE